MFGRAIAAAVLALVLTGCHPSPPANNPDAPPAPPAHVNSCTDACNNRAALGCPFQDGCFERCTSIGDQAFTDCETTATTCAKLTSCDKPKH